MKSHVQVFDIHLETHSLENGFVIRCFIRMHGIGIRVSVEVWNHKFALFKVSSIYYSMRNCNQCTLYMYLIDPLSSMLAHTYKFLSLESFLPWCMRILIDMFMYVVHDRLIAYATYTVHLHMTPTSDSDFFFKLAIWASKLYFIPFWSRWQEILIE